MNRENEKNQKKNDNTYGTNITDVMKEVATKYNDVRSEIIYQEIELSSICWNIWPNQMPLHKEKFRTWF